MSCLFYANVDTGFRSIRQILMIINEVFGGVLGDAIPTHTTIRDWCMKAGLAKYNEAGEEIKDSGKDYAAIVDESITVGSQKLMLTLGVPAEHPDHPLSRSSVP